MSKRIYIHSSKRSINPFIKPSFKFSAQKRSQPASIAATLGLLVSLVFSVTAHALNYPPSFDRIVVFGDSLSDTGNLNLINPNLPARFSNGPVAVEYVADQFGLSVAPSGFLAGQALGTNYAVGGAKAVDDDGNEATPDTNLPTQINAYLQANGAADPNTLYVVVIGGNDLFAAQTIRSGVVFTEDAAERKAIRKQARESVKAAVLSAEAQISKLLQAGAQQLLVGNAPDIGAVPGTDKLVAGLLANTTTKAQQRRANRLYKASSNLTALWNRKLDRAVGRLERNYHLDIIEWDLEAFLAGQIEDGEALGFSNVEDSCLDKSLTGECSVTPPTGFVFFDDVHPTTVVHGNAGADILELLAH